MTIDNATRIKNTSEVMQNMTVQNEVQKEILKDTAGAHSLPKQLITLISSNQPQQSVQETAKNQISRGFLDVKV